MPAFSLLRSVFVLLSLVIGLSACSGAPGEDDVQPLLQQSVREGVSHAREMAKALGGDRAVSFIESMGAPDPESISVRDVDIRDSQALDGGDYRLTVRYDVVSGDRHETLERSLRLGPSDNGWRLLSMSPVEGG